MPQKKCCRHHMLHFCIKMTQPLLCCWVVHSHCPNYYITGDFIFRVVLIILTLYTWNQVTAMYLTTEAFTHTLWSMGWASHIPPPDLPFVTKKCTKNPQQFFDINKPGITSISHTLNKWKKHERKRAVQTQKQKRSPSSKIKALKSMNMSVITGILFFSV